MKKLTKIYEDVLGEALLGEERVEFSQLNDTIAAIDMNLGIYQTIVLIDTLKIPQLKRYKYKDIIPALLGAIALKKDNNSEYSIRYSVAHKGYGLVIYELGMQAIYPSKLVSDRNWLVSSAAQRMYDYFYKELNPSVDVIKLTKDSPEYIHCKDIRLLPCNKPYEEQLYNSKLSMKPKELIGLVKKGEELTNILGGELIRKAAYKFFDEKM